MPATSVILTEWDEEGGEFVTYERTVHNGRIVEFPVNTDGDYVTASVSGYEPASTAKALIQTDSYEKVEFVEAEVVSGTVRTEFREFDTEPEATLTWSEPRSSEVPTFPVMTGVYFRKHATKGLAGICYRCQRGTFLADYDEADRGVAVSPEYAAQSFVIAGMVHWYAHRQRMIPRTYE